jgi:Peptide methionine sulfoxide reductase
MIGSTESSILTGGCGWGRQDLLRHYSGVISTRVGYKGGDALKAMYRSGMRILPHRPVFQYSELITRANRIIRLQSAEGPISS